jgi:catechol 2,3-dioxygenase-like lactoylglutathione lyase family enzyme
MNTEVIGIDHIYIAVRDLPRSEAFYDLVMPALGFKKNNFPNEGDRHVQYYNRHFGFISSTTSRTVRFVIPAGLRVRKKSTASWSVVPAGRRLLALSNFWLV